MLQSTTNTKLKGKLITILIISFLGFNNTSNAQFTISVKPSLNFLGVALYEGSVGYKFSKVVTFTGLQYYAGSFSRITTGQEYDYLLGQVVDVNRESKSKAGIYMPFIGAKYFISPADKEDVKFYLISIVSKPFVTGSDVEDGEEDENVKDRINSIKLWGLQQGIGAEYFINESFSFGAEFGIRFFTFKEEDRRDRTAYIYDPVTFTSKEVNYTTIYKEKTNLGFTYTSFSFNFYM